MDWTAWIKKNVQGAPIALDALVDAFPRPVVTYGITKWGPKGEPASSTKRMSLADFVVAQITPKILQISWSSGMTTPSPETPKAVMVDPGSISFAVQDVLAARKMTVQLAGQHPQTGAPIEQEADVYGLYVREGEGLLVIEMLDIKGSFTDEPRVKLAR